MARPKLIEDSILLELIKKYFYEECCNNPKNLRPPLIVKYINNHGYPNYPVTTLRRTKSAMDYIEELKKTINDENYVTTSSYQTIDAALLVDSNRSRSALIKAISERDYYYKAIADSATQSFERYNDLKKKLDTEKKNNDFLMKKVAELEKLNSEYQVELKELKKEQKVTKAVIETYVYPEIANELLVREGAVRKTKGYIKEDAFECKLITPATDIRKTVKSGSNVISGLFDLMEE